MIESLAFITYPVKDIAVARRFYEGILGLKLARSYHEDWFEYDLGDTTFAITSADPEHASPVTGALIAFEVDDLDAELPDCMIWGFRFGGRCVSRLSAGTPSYSIQTAPKS